VTFNLDTLKQELLDYIVSEGFAVFRGRLGDEVDEALWPPAACPDGDHHRRAVACADDHVRHSGRRMEEVPRPELALLYLMACAALALAGGGAYAVDGALVGGRARGKAGGKGKKKR